MGLTWFADAGGGPGVAVEAVLVRGVGHVTLPEVPGVTVLVTGAGPQLALASLSVTEVLRVTIRVIITLAGMVTQVADGGGVLTVQTAIVTSCVKLSNQVKCWLK